MVRQSCIAACIILWLASAVAAQPVSRSEWRREQFQKQHLQQLLNLRHELSELSRQCFEKGLAQAAKDVTEISLELTTTQQRPRLQSLVQLPVSTFLPPEEQLWRNRLHVIRQDKAQELYILARSALSKANLPSLAYELVLDVLKLAPDHKYARAVLGQRLFNDRARADDPTYVGEWVSPFEAEKRSGISPEVNHPQFGWIPASHVPRYEQGLRFWNGKWVSEQKEAELRRDFSNAWIIESEHFKVKTNASREEGVEISQKLEIFHDWLQTNFVGFFETPAALKARFDQIRVGRSNRRTAKPMEVHYYATRDEYDRRMQGKIPAGIVTNGFYWEQEKTCYLFRNPDGSGLSTAFHEATHQIFDLATIDDRLSAARKRRIELRQRRVTPWVMCENSNFWMLEGIACYMESFEINDGVISVGRPDYIRFVAAQQRLLRDNFFVPLQLLSSLGKESFQHHVNRPQLYSQGSGVAHFLLHYDNGAYRDAFVKLLAAAYRPDLRRVTEEPSLEKMTGVKFAVLDQQYREHMENLAIRVAAKR
ncbi:MAG TPA: hypothetical protein EYG03_14480 [Planctomycetes bacterium]|nr:hypothetical protein [Fuerstiella sp.]HIK93167.1 hypothetical protein [Planctomycetota bacterium]